MSIRKNMGLWRNWVRSALARTSGSRPAVTLRRRNSRRGDDRSCPVVELLECRSLLAVTFQLNFVNDGSIGFNDPNAATRQARRDAHGLVVHTIPRQSRST